MSEVTKLPWKNGYYYNKYMAGMIMKLDRNTANLYLTGMKLDFPKEDKPICAPGSWTFGDFGPANEEVVKASGGIKNYNVEVSVWFGIYIFFHYSGLK